MRRVSLVAAGMVKVLLGVETEGLKELAVADLEGRCVGCDILAGRKGYIQTLRLCPLRFGASRMWSRHGERF